MYLYPFGHIHFPNFFTPPLQNSLDAYDINNKKINAYFYKKIHNILI